MSVQSARVQQIVKGDDVVMTHQILTSVAYNAEIGRTPVEVASTDLVNFFYPLADLTKTDLIGYLGVPIGSYPTSQFTVPIPGIIVDPLALQPNRGTISFQANPAQTVRAQISRFVASPTGNTLINNATITGLSSTVGLVIGQRVVGAGVPFGAFIIAIGSGQITLSANPTATATGVTLDVYSLETHYLIAEVDIFERGFPVSLDDTSGGANPPPQPLNLP